MFLSFCTTSNSNSVSRRRNLSDISVSSANLNIIISTEWSITTVNMLPSRYGRRGAGHLLLPKILFWSCNYLSLPFLYVRNTQSAFSDHLLDHKSRRISLLHQICRWKLNFRPSFKSPKLGTLPFFPVSCALKFPLLISSCLISSVELFSMLNFE